MFAPPLLGFNVAKQYSKIMFTKINKNIKMFKIIKEKFTWQHVAKNLKIFGDRNKKFFLYLCMYVYLSKFSNWNMNNASNIQ